MVINKYDTQELATLLCVVFVVYAFFKISIRFIINVDSFESFDELVIILNTIIGSTNNL